VMRCFHSVNTVCLSYVSAIPMMFIRCLLYYIKPCTIRSFIHHYIVTIFSPREFLALESEDLSVEYLEKRFSNDVDILESGSKCGFVVQIADDTDKPKYQLQLTTLYQEDQEGKLRYAVELWKAPSPTQDKPWKVMIYALMFFSDLVYMHLNNWNFYYRKYYLCSHFTPYLSLT